MVMVTGRCLRVERGERLSRFVFQKQILNLRFDVSDLTVCDEENSEYY